MIGTIITIPTDNPYSPFRVLDMMLIAMLRGHGVLLLAEDGNACDLARAFIQEDIEVNGFEKECFQREHLWEAV
jgi:hypothetical protein